MANFREGEIAIYAGVTADPSCIGRIQKGDEVTLIRCSGLFEMWIIDRTSSDGIKMAVSESSLRKRPDDSQQRFRDTLKPCDKDFSDDLATWLRPTETEVKEGLKGILQPFDNHFEGFDK